MEHINPHDHEFTSIMLHGTRTHNALAHNDTSATVISYTLLTLKSLPKNMLALKFKTTVYIVTHIFQEINLILQWHFSCRTHSYLNTPTFCLHFYSYTLHTHLAPHLYIETCTFSVYPELHILASPFCVVRNSSPHGFAKLLRTCKSFKLWLSLSP